MFNWLNKLKFWEKKTPPLVIAEFKLNNPMLTFEIKPDGLVYVHAFWDNPKNQVETEVLLKSFTQLIYNLQTGMFSKAIKEAMIFNGKATNSLDMANAMILAFDNWIQTYWGSVRKQIAEEKHKAGNKLWMLPSEVFNVNHEQGHN